MFTKLARLRKLRWGELVQLPLLLAGVVLVDLALAIFGYGRTLRTVERLSQRKAPQVGNLTALDRARRLAWRVDLVGRHGPVRRSCLRCALLTYGLLRWRGLRPILRLGLPVQPQAATFMAHAWVEVEGTPLLPGDVRYTPFISGQPPPSL